MNYKEALAYLYGFSDYERGGPFTRNREENLERENSLLARLGNPHLDYPCTLIAGTKGKGSTAAIIERVLREAGLCTGLYTQPDLHTFRERIRVNGRLISENEAAELLTELRPVVAQVQEEEQFAPFNTYQVGTALAFLYFSRQHIDHAVLEVGLGGRLDATNITRPLVSVIASISYDHMQVLGHTLREIATEKAGIIKPEGIVVTSAQSPEALLAIAAVCRQRHAHMVRIGAVADDPARVEVEVGLLPAISYSYRLESRSEELQRFTVFAPQRDYEGLEIPLVGQHQLENATLALAVLEQLRERGILWDEAALHTGLRSVQWAARLQEVGQRPRVIIDGAHNADSMQKLIQALEDTFTWRQLIVVLGVAQDKDLPGIVRALAGVDTVILTRANNPRAAALEKLHAVFAENAPRVRVVSEPDSSAALDMAVGLASADDLICATGSLYLAGEALRWSAERGNTSVAATIEGVDH